MVSRVTNSLHLWVLIQVRREKISERMKYLQDLVPGCNKITGKAGMLDEIINYVQSLQRQVEVNQVANEIVLVFLQHQILYSVLIFYLFMEQFLSMKLATVNPRLDFNIDDLIAKEVNTYGRTSHAEIFKQKKKDTKKAEHNSFLQLLFTGFCSMLYQYTSTGGITRFK